MNNTLYGADVISIKDLSKDQILLVLDKSAQFKKKTEKKLLEDKIIANCFFEPSTRTRLSFESAAIRLGGSVIGFADAESTSLKKGETLMDSVNIISKYADLIVIRHPKAGAARLCAEVSTKPVINAGDASNQHPTQALVDLFTIAECQKKIDGLSIAIVGDLKYGRTVHSLVQALALFDVRLFLVSPEYLSLPDQLCDVLKTHGVKFSFHQALEDIIPKVDILYMTRIQQERFVEEDFVTKQNQLILKQVMLKKAKSHLKILHPLPRVNEIETAIDETPFAHYFVQAENGICVRQALLTLLLKK